MPPPSTVDRCKKLVAGPAAALVAASHAATGRLLLSASLSLAYGIWPYAARAAVRSLLSLRLVVAAYRGAS